MTTIVMINPIELNKELGFRKMIKSIGTYRSLDERVDVELEKLEQVEEEDDDIFLW